MRLRAVALVAAAVLAQGRGAGGSEVLGYAIRVEAGAEHDSNPARLETVAGASPARPIVPSPALRLVTAADLHAGIGRGHVLSISGGLAGKRFFQAEARAEDLIIAEAGARFQLRPGPGWGLGLDAGYYDVFQRAGSLGEARDFRSATPSLRIEHASALGSFALGAGWRWFTFKPEPTFDFSGPTVMAAFNHMLAGDPAGATASVEWALAAGAGLEFRNFAVASCQSLDRCPPLETDGSDLRRDRFWSAHIDVSRTGALLLGGGLFLGANESSSYGESLWRLAASVRAVWLLPWQFSLATRGDLVATRYREAVPVGHNAITGTFVSIEEEGRSTVRLELVRPLGSRLELGARYTFYVQASVSPVKYQRQLVLLYLAFAR
jgi:hypothetical protein